MFQCTDPSCQILIESSRGECLRCGAKLKLFDDASFWRKCCESGISICGIPKPFQESEKESWLVSKTETFLDRKKWESSYTFGTINQVYVALKNYFEQGVEPKI